MLAAPARRRGAGARRRHPVRRGQPPDRRRALRADGHRARARAGDRAPRRTRAPHIAYAAGPRGSWADAAPRRHDRARVRAPRHPTHPPQPPRGVDPGRPRRRRPAAASGATAVVAYNDLVALGLEAGLTSSSVERCPADISIVGIDDIDLARAPPARAHHRADADRASGALGGRPAAPGDGGRRGRRRSRRSARSSSCASRRHPLVGTDAADCSSPDQPASHRWSRAAARPDTSAHTAIRLQTTVSGMG